jgi:acyl-ACP thioesterase
MLRLVYNCICKQRSKLERTMQNAMQSTTVNANYVFVMLDDNTIVLHINNSVYVNCTTVAELIAAFKQYNITDTDTIMYSSDVEFASEYDFAYDSEASDMLDEVYDALNFKSALQ